MSGTADDAREAGEATLSAAEVARYIRRHPDFLIQHPGLLTVLTPPERGSGDGVIDLQRAMVERLRGELAQAAARERSLMDAVEANAVSLIRVQRAVLALLDARSFAAMIETVHRDLPAILDLEAVALAVESEIRPSPEAGPVGIALLEPGTVARFLADGEDMALRAVRASDGPVLGRGGARVRSVALLRLRIGEAAPPGLLALGAAGEDGFHSGQATDLLSFFATVVEQCIRRWMTQPA